MLHYKNNQLGMFMISLVETFGLVGAKLIFLFQFQFLVDNILSENYKPLFKCSVSYFH
jgi:hypothetical protein